MKIANTMLHVDKVVKDKNNVFSTLKLKAYNLITDELMTKSETKEWTDHLDSRNLDYAVLSAHTKRPQAKGFVVLTDMDRFYNPGKDSDGIQTDVSTEEEVQTTKEINSLDISDLEMFEDQNNV